MILLMEASVVKNVSVSVCSFGFMLRVREFDQILSGYDALCRRATLAVALAQVIYLSALSLTAS
jgi:hypothetical protein